MTTKIRIPALPAILALTLALLTPVFAQNTPSVPTQANVTDNETPQLWFVEFAGAPTSDGGTKDGTRAEHDDFRNAARAAGIRYTDRRSFDSLWNGVSVSIKPSELSKLSRLPQVANLYPVENYQVPEPTDGYIPQLATAIIMTGANTVQAAGITGAGVRVGVIDTGIDYDHPDLGGSGVNGGTPFPTARVRWGYDFVGDAYDANLGSIPVPDNNPDDGNGHGTHVAGIIGANGVVKGVAPGVVFGAYRVFGNSGSTSADIMIAAMEMALADGMQVVNMSIGSAFQWPQYPTAKAADRLVKKGVVVVCSIGNNGANGLYSASAPGVGKDVIGVASFDNTHNALPEFTVSPDASPIGYSSATGSPNPPKVGTYPLAKANLDGTPLVAGDLVGKIALIKRGTYSFYSKALNAQNAGAIAVVLYNNAPGRVNPTVAGSPAITIPVVAISDTEGALIDGRLTAGPVDLTWTSTIGSFPAPAATAGLISSFSSYGLSPDLALKPDIGAPGGNIFSTFPLEQGGYASLSGTSMASPHVAGTAALYLEAFPRTDAKDIEHLLQNTAEPKPWWGNPALGFLDNVHRQGAGMVAIDRAILATGEVQPGKLSLGESTGGPVTRTLTIENTGSSTTTYDLSDVAALSTGPNTFTPSFYGSDAFATFSVPSVTVGRHKKASVSVTITPASGPDKGIYGGYLVLTPRGGGEVLRVPYAGFIGDYQSIQVLAPTAYGFPWLSSTTDGSGFTNQPNGATYTMVGLDIPFIAAHFDHESRKVVANVYDARTGRPWYTAFSLEYFGRNSTASGFFALDWDGVTTKTHDKSTKEIVVPNGKYVLKLSVLKALGNEDNPADWETWTSPVITIARP
jgi:subtilisin family serine protease